jgi:pyridoxamine 5'-phosphate oxidase
MPDAIPPESRLPEILPENPMPLIDEWMAEAFARRVRMNANSMTLATVDPDGKPTARVVLCKKIEAEQGWLDFYTNLRSPKGRHLLIPDEEADAYFESRPLQARLSAIASDQSEPVESREALLRKFRELAAHYGVGPETTEASVPRPKHWGGYRLWAEQVELWVGLPDRLHDRAMWRRTLRAGENGFAGDPWQATRLQP